MLLTGQRRNGGEEETVPESTSIFLFISFNIVHFPYICESRSDRCIEIVRMFFASCLGERCETKMYIISKQFGRCE